MSSAKQLPMRYGTRGPLPGHGGRPKMKGAGVSHLKRAALASRYPVHVTVRLAEGLPRLRNRRTRAVLWEAFHRGAERFGFRLVQFSIQSNHLHLVAEAKDRKALARGLQGLFIRVAKALNRLWARAGRVFADRYHDRILRTPTEVRNALAYVLNNARRHGATQTQVLDDFASGAWFDGWRDVEIVDLEGVPRPVAMPHTWLLRVGWRRARGGALRADENPRAPRSVRLRASQRLHAR